MKESPVVDGVREIELESWREFFDLTTQLFATAPAYVYRGQANSDWLLVSSLDRLEERFPKRKNLCGPTPDFFNRPPLSEKEHLNAFKQAVRGRRGDNPPKLTDDEYWALGQHHGLATPLLDWTRLPFVALFFAFEEEECALGPGHWGKPAYRGVYALSTSTISAPPPPRLAPLDVLSPDTDANYRLIGQAALFIRVPRHVDLDTYMRQRFAGNEHGASFTKVKIPNANRDDCLVALNKMNINHMSLFADIGGAAKHVNSLWQPGHEDSIAYV